MLRIDRRWIWAHGLLLIAQLAALWWLGRLTPLAQGFPLDDAWIHQVIGRTFADTGVLGYSPDAFGSGATSLLWGFLAGLNHAVLGVDPTTFTLIVNALLFTGTGQVWLSMLRHDGLPFGAAVGAAVFAATAPNFVWFAWSGMESVCLVFLSTVTIALWTSAGAGSRARAWGAGFTLTLAFLTRPEAAALLVPLALFRPWAGRSWRDLARVLAPLAATMIAYAVAMASATGRARPSTLEGRRIIWFQTVATSSPFELAERMIRHWGERLAEYNLSLPPSAVLFYLAFTVFCLGILTAFRYGWTRLLTLGAWGALHILVYVILLPTPGHGGRYQPLTPSLFMVFSWIGLYSIGPVLSRAFPKAQNVMLVATASLCAVLSIRALSMWAVTHREAVAHVWNTEVAMGRIVAELPREARVASFDIGGIGYFGRRPLIDLGGLVDPSVVPALRESKAWPLLQAREVDYVVVPEGYSHGIPDPWNFHFRLGLHRAPEGRLVAVERVASPEWRWKLGIEATLHASPVQVLYRVAHTD